MISQAQFEVVLTYVRLYRDALHSTPKPLRLFISVLDIIGSFPGMPDDVAVKLDDLVSAMYDAARLGMPIPEVSIGTICGVQDGTIIVLGLRFPLSIAA